MKEGGQKIMLRRIIPLIIIIPILTATIKNQTEYSSVEVKYDVAFSAGRSTENAKGKDRISLRDAVRWGLIQKTNQDIDITMNAPIENPKGSVVITETDQYEAIIDPAEPVTEVSVVPEAIPHEHSWDPIVKVIHHDPVYQTVHHEAVTERVWIEDRAAYDETYENTYLIGIHDICKGCGMDITASGMSYEEYDAHDRQHILNGEDSSYYSEPIYQTVIETVHHEAEGHYEDMVVQEAYDETILISEAWDEQVVTGYRCCECGALK